MSEQQTTLPLHPSLEALNLPPLPWRLHNHPASTAIADANRTEVLYVSGFPDLDVTGLHLGCIERSDAAVIAIANVVAASPELLNWMLIYRDSLKNPIGREDYNLWLQQAQALDAIVARALGQEGGSDA